MGCVVIVSGPVGAGKTSVCRELIALATAPTVYIEGDQYWSFIVKPAPFQPANQRFRMIMRAMLASARHFERDGYEVIVDFSVPPWYLDAVRALLKDCPCAYVVLRPSEATCSQRAASRTAGTIADYAPYRELYRAFDGFEPYTIADDERDPAQVAAHIRDALQAGAFRID